MPSFPTSVFAPTNKSNGQTIDASHVNDLQNEVVAIEGGYINGTAPLNSSGSTVGTLSVTGGSTFASRPLMPPPEAIRVTDCTSALDQNTTNALTWPTQVYAINSSIHSTGTNPSRFTPQTTGVFVMDAGVQIVTGAANSTAWLQLEIEDSSGTLIGRSNIQGFGGSVAPIARIAASKRFDVVGGWLRIVGKQASGSSHSVFGSASWCDVRKL